MSEQTGLQKLQQEREKLGVTTARERLVQLFDDGVFTELDSFAKSGDNYAEVITGFGTVEGNPVYAFSQDSSVMGGAMGTAQANKIKRIYDLAVKTGAPVVGVYDSNGAHLNEGIDSLAAYGDLILKSNNISGVVPQLSLVLGVCGGSSAVLASLADVVIISEKASFFLTPPSVLGSKTGDAATACASGSAHLCASDDASAIAKARAVLAMLPVNNLSSAQAFEFAAPSVDASALEAMSASGEIAVETVVAALTDAGSALELSKEYAPELKTLFAFVNGASCGLVACDSTVSGGRITAAGAKKAARFVRFCDAFSLPVLTIVDTNGFEASEEAEKAAILKEAAALTHAYSEATTPKISLIVGNAIGSAFTALAGRASNVDTVFAWPNAVISSLLPETAVSILWNDRVAGGEKREELIPQYIASAASAFTAAACGHIDDVIEPSSTYAKVGAALDMLAGKRVSTLAKKHSNMPL